MQFFKNPKFDFLGKQKLTLGASGIIIVIGLVFFIIHGGFNYSIDFTGGTIVQASFGKTVDVSLVRKAVDALDIGTPEIQTLGSEKETIIIRFQDNEEEERDISLAIMETLRAAFPKADGYKIELEKSEKVGPKIGSELRESALKAIIFSLGLMLIYIWIRFQFRFGVAAILALIHDVLITLAVFAIFDIEIGLTVVAALLTIIGYSINDTIVISDRIRENMKVLFRKKFDELVNVSLNQVLGRTVVTSLSTLIVCVAILLFAGSAIFEFALALTIGVIVGTYSSIFVVSPVVIYWEKKFPKKMLKR